MFRLFTGRRQSLVRDALTEACNLLEAGERMFVASCDALFDGRTPDLDVVKKDGDIDVGERLIRRLVAQHLAVNPEEDLPSSLVIIGIAHDLERIGDYTKSLFYLTKHGAQIGADEYGEGARKVREMVAPMFGMTRGAFEESDRQGASEVLKRHDGVKEATGRLLDRAVAETGTPARAGNVLALQYMRRISSHLANIASSVTNPFDRLGGTEA